MRDAACAAEARARNAAAQSACDEGIRADVVQIGDLIDQVREQSAAAIAAGPLSATQWARLDRRLTRAEPYLATAAADPTETRALKRAASRIGRVCRKLGR